MKRVFPVILLSVLCIGLILSCDTGAGPEQTATPSPSSETVEVTPPPPPAPTPVPADPAVYGTWYAFVQNQYGLALMRTTQTFSATAFEEIDEFWNGSGWTAFYGVRGSLSHVSGPAFTATLEEINLGGTWVDSSYSDFEGQRSHYWSMASNVARISLAVSSGNLAYKRDMDGDDAVDGASDSQTVLGTSDSTALTGSGEYPFLCYVGFNFGGSATQASCSAQIMSMSGNPVDESGIASVRMKLKHGVNESDYFDLGYMPPEDEYDMPEWGLDDYVLTDPSEGLWYVSEVEIIGQAGNGSATYTRSDPSFTWAVDYSTNSTPSYESTTTAELMLGQCYMPAAIIDPSTEAMYYITAVANASSSAYHSDLVLYLYGSGNTENWIALKDDGDTDAFPDMKIALLKGGTYYLKVMDLNGAPGTYSLRVSTGAYNNAASTAAVAMGEDAYEDDDTPAGAKEIAVGELQDRALTSGEADWVKIVVPN